MPKINYSLPGKNEEHRYNNPERNVSVVEPVKQKVQDERIYSRRSSKSQNEGEKLAE